MDRSAASCVQPRCSCTAHRAIGLTPSGDSQVGRGPVLRAAGVSGRGPCGQSRVNLLRFNSQPHCTPAPAAALDRAALRNGQVPHSSCPTPHAVCSTSVAVTEPRDLPALPSGQRSPLPDVSPSGRVSTHLSGPTRHLPRNTSACDPPGPCSHRQADRCSACTQTGETLPPISRS